MKEFTLYAVGDVCLGDSLISLNFGTLSSLLTHGSNYIFEHVRDVLAKGDIIFGNLESPLSKSGYDKCKPDSRYLRSFPEAIDTLKDGRFTIMNVANNHTLQHGSDAFNETITLLRANAIVPIGLRGYGEYSSEPFILEKDGRKIGFLSYSYEREQYFKQPLLYADGPHEAATADISRLKSDVDSLVVSMHWGLEYMNDPTHDMVSQAHDIIDSGADVILGHHPHVLQGIENYRDKVIVYSMGNFVFDKTWWKNCFYSGIFKIGFSGESVTCDFLPARINASYQPVLCDGKEKEKMQIWMQYLSERITKVSSKNAKLFYFQYKLKLMLMFFTKLFHIFTNITKYDSHFLRYFFRRKLLRIR